ncbi:hypothetical protein AVEN_244725-1 [Araneus ventricosus]|uniref:Uncharacterized protein n=1 Tax=Araneus ventricosus TaxID=182803 RepID=A0A4Y2BSS5_ARAVE|nr:hypothetical protein AVEN_244725-1 [Araneus ventricosus]
MGCGKDNWTLYCAHILSDLRTSPPLKRSQSPQPGLRRCYGEIFRPPRTASLGLRGLIQFSFVRLRPSFEASRGLFRMEDILCRGHITRTI